MSFMRPSVQQPSAQNSCLVLDLLQRVTSVHDKQPCNGSTALHPSLSCLHSLMPSMLLWARTLRPEVCSGYEPSLNTWHVVSDENFSASFSFDLAQQFFNSTVLSFWRSAISIQFISVIAESSGGDGPNIVLSHVFREFHLVMRFVSGFLR